MASGDGSSEEEGEAQAYVGFTQQVPGPEPVSLTQPVAVKRAQIYRGSEAEVASIANVWRGLATVHKHVVRQCLKAECLLRWQGQCKLMCRVRQALQCIVWASQQTHCMCSAPAQMISTCCGAHALLSMGCVWQNKVWNGCVL